ncbi:multiprotein-bridging factor 1 family protein [Altericista sp. CCNU0014]|uniref:helix-turn-helix domain-containing protein n=1 Tax=Altericista sp. CCNU0014 TaxID=3082949 RepID=UPI00384D5131
MRQPHPAASPFTLTQGEILEQLDWTPAPAAPAPAAPAPLELASPELALLLERLASLRIATLWMTEPSATRVEAYRTSGHPWEILLESQGDLDWIAGRIAAPAALTLTLRPGLWLPHLLQQGGHSARSAWKAFGRFALTLLQRDCCRDSFLIGLLIPPILNAPQPHPDARLPVYTVRHLLEAALPASALPSLPLDPTLAPALLKAWNRALDALLSLGWSNGRANAMVGPADFYIEPYPSWLNPGSTSRKPPDWIEQWFAQPLRLVPPTDLLGLPPDPGKKTAAPSRPARRLRFDRLTGAEIRAARKAKQLTQSQLADALHVHQSLIAKIEVGQRALSEALERSLRQVLDL